VKGSIIDKEIPKIYMDFQKIFAISNYITLFCETVKQQNEKMKEKVELSEEVNEHFAEIVASECLLLQR
jgi:hemerythrin